MIKRVVVGVAATVLFGLGAGVALAQAGKDSAAGVTPVPAVASYIPDFWFHHANVDR